MSAATLVIGEIVALIGWYLSTNPRSTVATGRESVGLVMILAAVLAAWWLA